jgi:hypothetical protein
MCYDALPSGTSLYNHPLRCSLFYMFRCRRDYRFYIVAKCSSLFDCDLSITEGLSIGKINGLSATVF